MQEEHRDITVSFYAFDVHETIEVEYTRGRVDYKNHVHSNSVRGGGIWAKMYSLTWAIWRFNS